MRDRWALLLVAVFVLLVSCDRPAEERAQPTPEPVGSPCVLEGADEATVADDRTAGEIPLLTDVLLGEEGCPSVAFVFENEVPPHTVGYRDPPFAECGSGREVPTAGWGASAYIVFHSLMASGVDLSGETFRETYTDERDIDVGGDVLRRIRQTCDFEATLEWVIALDARRPFRVSTRADPPRVVIDVAG